jgi:hypothetical protein
MDYKKKIEYAENVAKDLDSQKPKEQIIAALEAEGLYDRDITNIFASARKILGESYRPKIRASLLKGEDVYHQEEFTSLDKGTLEQLVASEVQYLATKERKKLIDLVKEGKPADEVLKQIDTRFLPIDRAAEQIANAQSIQKQNSISGRTLNIAGGLGLILLTGIILIAFERLFYVLPIIGIGLIVKGFFAQDLDYDS